MDDALPSASIEGGPGEEQVLLAPVALFELGCDAQPCELQCRVDDQAFESCRSPYQTKPVPPGEHSFEVRSTRGAAVGRVVSRRFQNRLPYEMVRLDKPIVAEDDRFQGDFRCRRIDAGWDGESLIGALVSVPFQCPMEYWLAPAEGGDEPDFKPVSGFITLEVPPGTDYVLHVRVKKPQDDPVPWPEGSFTEHALEVLRSEPAEPYVPRPVETPNGGAIQLGLPIFDTACAMRASSNLGDPADVLTLIVPLAGVYPPGSQLSYCSIRVPLTVASGFSAARAELRLQGFADLGGRADVQVELDGIPLVDARVDPTRAQVALPISYLNWSSCARDIDLTITVDLTSQDANEGTFAALDILELDLEAQANFDWQTCSR